MFTKAVSDNARALDSMAGIGAGTRFLVCMQACTLVRRMRFTLSISHFLYRSAPLDTAVGIISSGGSVNGFGVLKTSFSSGFAICAG